MELKCWFCKRSPIEVEDALDKLGDTSGLISNDEGEDDKRYFTFYKLLDWSKLPVCVICYELLEHLSLKTIAKLAEMNEDHQSVKAIRTLVQDEVVENASIVFGKPE